ncbi:MAG: filamentous hemagglutinin N-terminal domain-containing protein [Parachlamydiales bacterium]|nr:filamentous hemagglutinin N-terminal domain-containing protein [Parachlamydiales bacterium]
MSRFLTLSFALASNIIFAHPENPQVRAGQASFVQNEHLLEIFASDNAIIGWKDFSIQSHETARFVLPSQSAKVLNRVIGKIPSSIQGALESNGQIFLLNPNGVLIGKDAKIKTAGFFVTTFELADEDFLSGGYFQLDPENGMGIENLGRIEALDGEIFLIAKTVENQGSIIGKNVTVAAGGEWIIQNLDPKRPKIKTSKQLSDSEALNPYAAAIRHSGAIEAIGYAEKDGNIFLISENEIELFDHANLTSLNGGEIRALGKNICVEEKVQIESSSDAGGKIVLVSEGAMQFLGTAVAEGKELDGGFVEISGSPIHFHGIVSTYSQKGKTGTLLLDPLDIMISTAADFAVTTLPGPIFEPTDPLCMSNLSTATLTGALASNNVTVKTTGTAGACLGDIIVKSPFTWSSANSLTFDAAHDLIVQEQVYATGKGAIIATVGNAVSINPGAGAGPAELRTTQGAISLTAAANDIVVTGGTLPSASSGIFSDSGTITLSPHINLTVMGGPGVGAYAEISSRAGPINGSIGAGGVLTVQGGGPNAYAQIGVGTASTGINVSSTITFTFDVNAGDLDVLGGTFSGAYAQIGHAPHPAGNNTTVAGSIIFNPPNLGVGNNINVTGGGIQSTAIIGHGNELSGNIATASGDFQIYAQGAITVQGGTIGSQSHAVIGFHTPEGGPSGSYSATSNLLDVRTLISGDILINGGTGSNGVIGYYNNSSLTPLASVDIKSINIVPTDSNVVTLTAGKLNATPHGAAVLGTMDLLGSANSNITIVSGGLSVLGPQLGANDGAARLINGRPNVNAGRSILIDCASTPLIASIAVLGGIGLSPGFAEIYSSGTLNMQLFGHLYVNRSLTVVPILQNGPAQIVSYGATTVNGSFPCMDVVVLGGTNTGINYRGSALFQSISSTINVGTAFSAGAIGLTVGYVFSEAPSQILTSSGTSVISYTGVGVLQGGQANLNAPHASAEIRSDLGNLQLTNGMSLSLTGGTGLLCFAEISSTMGNVLINNISGPITLSGGTTIGGINAYAQIGRGIGINTPQVMSSITFDNIGAVSLTAFDGPGAYVQIGQSPTDPVALSTVVGDVIFNSGAANLLLQGGSAITNTAIIGHGNELTPRLFNVSGSINVIVNAAGTSSLFASPTVGQAHAIIGFCNPKAGSAASFNVNSGSVSLLSRGNTHLKAGVFGSNAIIGYYNGVNPQLTPVNLTIQNVTMDGNNGAVNVLLEAGNDPGTGAVGEAPVGIAAIGTLVNSGGSFAYSNVTVTASTLTLLGPTAGNNGSARIVNSHPNTANPVFNIAIQPTTNINVLGGVGLPNGFADIYSTNNLSIQYFGNFYINEAFPVFQNGYAHVVASQNVEINTTAFGTDMRLTGGNSNMASGGSADALIQALNGHCFVGNFSPATNNIYIGRTGSESPSKIEAFQDQIAVGASLDIILQGGKANLGPPQATAQIRNLNGAINITAGQNLTLNGGTGPLTFAQIGSFHGNVTVSQVGKDLTLNGGSGLQAYAQIGIGYDLTQAIINSSITFFFVGGKMILNGAIAGDSGYAQIGHSPFGAMLFYSATGDVLFPTFGSIGLGQLNGGSVNNSTAIIGHGNPLSSNLNIASGSITAGSSDLAGLTLNAGTGSESHAVIGYFNPVGGSTPSFTVQSNQISVNTLQGPITLNANAAMNATIGYYHPAASATPISVQVGNISMQTGTGLPPLFSNFINLNADTGFPNGIASIGTFGPTGSTTRSGIRIQAVELNLNGPPAGKDGAARVINNQPFICSFDLVQISALNINVIGGLGTGFSDIYSSNQMTLSFNGTLNVNLNPAAPAVLQNGNATITSCKDLNITAYGTPPNNLGNIFILGGSNPAVQSQIVSNTGNVNVGNYLMDMQGAKQINIGRADMMGPARMTAAQGNINLVTSGSVNISGGAAAGADADLTAFGSLIGTVGGDFDVTGGVFGNATAVAGNGPINLVSRGSVNLIAQGATTASIVELGLNNDSVTIEAVNNLNMGLNTFIQNQGSGNMVLNAGADAVLMNNAYIQNLMNGSLNFFTGISMYLLNQSQILSNGGSVSLVVDNLFPTEAIGIGNGAFLMDGGAVVNSNGGLTRIFTARRPLNRIEGVINGQIFVPGPEFVNSNEEIWGVYYFSALGGNPFTVFYKEIVPIPVVPAINNLVTRSNNEFYYDLRSFDDFIFTAIPINVYYDSKYFAEETLDYRSLRRFYRDYHLLHIDTLGEGDE